MSESDFISLWRQDDQGQVTIRKDAIDSVLPRVWYNSEGHEDGFKGSEVTLRNGCSYLVDESTRTITARLGVEL